MEVKESTVVEKFVYSKSEVMPHAENCTKSVGAKSQVCFFAQKTQESDVSSESETRQDCNRPKFPVMNK
jgi:hypothetical protein